MNEIKCPNCGTVFKIDENEYQSIVKQIRDKEFEKEITLRDKQHELDKENSIKLHEAELEKEYIVDSSTPLPRDLAQSFEKGIRVDGVFYKCKKAQDVNARRMKIVLIEGKNREIRNVFQSREIGIKRLVRVRIGNIEMNDLKSGEFRELTQSEVQGLLKLCRDKQI